MNKEFGFSDCSCTTSGHLVFSLPESGDALREPMTRFLLEEAEKADYESALMAKSDDLSDYPIGPLLIVGTPETNPLIQSFMELFKIEIGPRNIHLLGTDYPVLGPRLKLSFTIEEWSLEVYCASDFASLMGFEVLRGGTVGNSLEVSSREGEIALEAKLTSANGTFQVDSPVIFETGLFLIPDHLYRAYSKELYGSIELDPDYSGDPFSQMLKKVQLLFLGEVHGDRSTAIEQHRLVRALHLSRGFSVLAAETLFSTWPVLETLSQGGSIQSMAKNLDLSEVEYRRWLDKTSKNPLLTLIQGFNLEKNDNEKLVFTALDLDHAINHTRPISSAFLKYLIQFSDSEAFQKEAKTLLSPLVRLRNKRDIIQLVQGMEELVREYQLSFPQDILDEFLFALELQKASIRFQLPAQEPKETENPGNIRGEYFRKTLRRALKKAKTRGGKVVALVGFAHASYWGDARLGRTVAEIPEAKYFQSEISSSKVFSIKLEPLKLVQSSTDPGIQIALDIMGHRQRAYVDLRSLDHKVASQMFPSYFQEGIPRFDGLLLVDEATQ